MEYNFGSSNNLNKFNLFKNKKAKALNLTSTSVFSKKKEISIDLLEDLVKNYTKRDAKNTTHDSTKSHFFHEIQEKKNIPQSYSTAIISLNSNLEINFIKNEKVLKFLEKKNKKKIIKVEKIQKSKLFETKFPKLKSKSTQNLLNKLSYKKNIIPERIKKLQINKENFDFEKYRNEKLKIQNSSLKNKNKFI